MFGIFKSSTPETRLADDVTNAIEREIKICLREVDNDLLAGMVVNLAISNAYKAHKDNALLLSRGHNLPLNKTLEIIKVSTNKAIRKHLSNAEDFIIP